MDSSFRKPSDLAPVSEHSTPKLRHTENDDDLDPYFILQKQSQRDVTTPSVLKMSKDFSFNPVMQSFVHQQSRVGEKQQDATIQREIQYQRERSFQRETPYQRELSRDIQREISINIPMRFRSSIFNNQLSQQELLLESAHTLEHTLILGITQSTQKSFITHHLSNLANSVTYAVFNTQSNWLCLLSAQYGFCDMVRNMLDMKMVDRQMITVQEITSGELKRLCGKGFKMGTIEMLEGREIGYRKSEIVNARRSGEQQRISEYRESRQRREVYRAEESAEEADEMEGYQGAKRSRFNICDRLTDLVRRYTVQVFYNQW